jgi:hypothetical protein
MLSLIANWKRTLYGSILILLGGLLLIQTARIDGFLFWHGLKAENTELRDTLAKVEAAQKLAETRAREEKARIEAENERKAERAKADFESRLAANNAALRNWLQNNRRATGNPDLSSAAEATSGIAQAGPAPDLPTGYALVPINDLQLSAEAFAKLESLQSWAKSVSNN